jgi:hypothetical protein
MHAAAFFMNSTMLAACSVQHLECSALCYTFTQAVDGYVQQELCKIVLSCKSCGAASNELRQQL